MPFQIIRNDITKVKADAIVNTANPKPRIGRGTDSAIYSAAGKDLLLAERKKIGEITPGQAVSTEAFNLDAKYIIHTVGPAWIDGNHGERDILRSCYEKSLSVAAELKCRSIAFPLIASGVYGFPKDEALNIALAEIGKFLLTHEMKVLLVIFDRKALQLSEQLVGGIEQYIDDHSAHLIRESEYGGDYGASRRRRNSARIEELREEMYFASAAYDSEEDIEESADEMLAPIGTLPDVTGKSLDEVLGGTGETFQQRLFKRNRCKEDYKPKMKTAVAFAIALELDLPTTLDLLSRAEIAFSPSSRFDLIVTYFITNKIYDIFEINAALFKYGQPILGE